MGGNVNCRPAGIQTSYSSPYLPISWLFHLLYNPIYNSVYCCILGYRVQRFFFMFEFAAESYFACAKHLQNLTRYMHKSIFFSSFKYLITLCPYLILINRAKRKRFKTIAVSIRKKDHRNQWCDFLHSQFKISWDSLHHWFICHWMQLIGFDLSMCEVGTNLLYPNQAGSRMEPWAEA